MTSSRLTRPLAFGAVALAVLALAVAHARSRLRSRTIFAHRGFANEVPENTVEGVRFAASRADAVEIDVRRCGSGELVCVHDETLERLTGADRRVDETGWETLRELEVADGATVARFEDLLCVVPGDVLLNVELKERGLAADVLEALEDHDGEVLLSSFDADALAEVRARDEAIPLAYVFRTTTPSARAPLETAAALDCVAVHPRADLCFRTVIVPRAHRHGLAVNAWTVDSRLEAALVALVGADGVFVDSSW
ncbi:glycerophosphodiester phosphodiesterase [Natronoglomus mannanivorans]|uniref:Glycerophosphodiester phosphodiesterase n=1 Tax=Natronoglomus mannanivorans TaxID=2979990 RepID=A0AAP3E0H1_9EURY|nr:glycerophosphodiester phosphodiesterase [Halobacteria archaeon AArc-xg1-1]